MTDFTLYKAGMVHSMRSLLHEEGFIELVTPVLRKHADGRIARLQLESSQYLRDSPALALRSNLQFADKIFEIGTCFRPDKLDATHLPEFTMLDLYARGHNLEEVLSLAERILRLFYSRPINRFSFASLVRDRFGIDLFTDENAENRLHDRLRPKYGTDSDAFSRCLDKYMKAEVEPLSKNQCIVVVDLPLAGEVRAKLREGTVAIAERFEFQIEGLEVFHGYTDETDLSLFIDRAKRYNDFGSEDEMICEQIAKGFVPADSSGFGVGLERLCQVCSGEHDIGEFVASRIFT